MRAGKRPRETGGAAHAADRRAIGCVKQVLFRERSGALRFQAADPDNRTRFRKQLRSDFPPPKKNFPGRFHFASHKPICAELRSHRGGAGGTSHAVGAPFEPRRDPSSATSHPLRRRSATGTDAGKRASRCASTGRRPRPQISARPCTHARAAQPASLAGKPDDPFPGKRKRPRGGGRFQDRRDGRRRTQSSSPSISSA